MLVERITYDLFVTASKLGESSVCNEEFSGAVSPENCEILEELLRQNGIEPSSIMGKSSLTYNDLLEKMIRTPDDYSAKMVLENCTHISKHEQPSV